MRWVLEHIELTIAFLEKQPKTRETSLVRTKLDEAKFWAMEHIKNNELNYGNTSGTTIWRECD